MSTTPLPNSTKPLLLAGMTVILWSTGFVFTRIAVTYLSSYSVGLLRYFSASVVLILIGFYKKIGLPRWKDIPLFVVLGALGFSLYQILFNIAMTSITAATASVVMATVPVIAALFASIIFKEKLNSIGWIAVAIEFSGILLLTLWHREVSLGWGLVWMFAAALSFAAYNLIQRFSTKNYTPLQSTVYSIVASTILLLPFASLTLKELAQAPWQPIVAVVFMGIFPSAISFMLWSQALSTAKQLGDVTNFMFLTPLLSTLLEIIMIGDFPDPGTLWGGVTILLGVALFNNRHKIFRPLKLYN
ncbi:MAG: EamA family transporter [Sphaerochaetaceae bacterium]|nr:EamA family transporter [Sphaerochaetaceae bacterium]